MALVKASLTLFGGDTVIVRCSAPSRIHLMSDQAQSKETLCDTLSVQDRHSAWLTVPYTGVWNIVIDSRSQSLEHSISYVAA
ncbi:DUF1883 domain-containing protein [Intestinirhabdus alba]|jgi:hypothetical protein|uniref:DUF1883 domain-containing protein n=1 Tax=Intestinirhabdus alba TaxID=2899544 RepID=A0A6L6II69_9ENTR|nr:DUF1883 domain-containing protein [Intestinirhabdus alba]MTH46289.1 DUF1883 domain-containing protein [Intestinirhabdus alba]